MKNTLIPALVLFVMQVLWSTVAVAARSASFFSGGVSHSFVVDDEHVAVQSVSPDRILADSAWSALGSLGISVVPRNRARSRTVVGLPVMFSGGTAVGVLPSQIVFRTRAKPQLSDGFPPTTKRALFGDHVYLATLDSPMKALEVANELYRRPDVIYAHPDFIFPKNLRSGSEPYFSGQWHLKNTGQTGGKTGADIAVTQAWKITKGSRDVLVAVFDGGFDVEHEDLESTWATNPHEIPGDGIDNDENGYVDDVLGWNFWANNADVTYGPFASHGTSVAGLVAAPLNHKGVAGVCPNCRVLPLVFSGRNSRDAAAFHYAMQRGAHVITNSWGYPIGTPNTDVIVEAIDAASDGGRDGLGAFILFAMNNIYQDDCRFPYPDISSLNSVIAVSGSSDQDRKVSYTAFGPCMEILGPTYEYHRAGIATTDVTGSGGYNDGDTSDEFSNLDYTKGFSGTSAATPIVAGVIGLMLSLDLEIAKDDLLSWLFTNADKIEPDEAEYDTAGFSDSHGYGRVNAHAALSAMIADDRVRADAKSIEN